MYNIVRTASVVARTAGVLWSLDRHTWQDFLIEGTRERKQRLEQLVCAMPLFAPLSQPQAAKLVEHLQPAAIPPLASLAATEWWRLVSGEVDEDGAVDSTAAGDSAPAAAAAGGGAPLEADVVFLVEHGTLTLRRNVAEGGAAEGGAAGEVVVELHAGSIFGAVADRRRAKLLTQLGRKAEGTQPMHLVERAQLGAYRVVAGAAAARVEAVAASDLLPLLGASMLLLSPGSSQGSKSRLSSGLRTKVGLSGAIAPAVAEAEGAVAAGAGEDEGGDEDEEEHYMLLADLVHLPVCTHTCTAHVIHTCSAHAMRTGAPAAAARPRPRRVPRRAQAHGGVPLDGGRCGARAGRAERGALPAGRGLSPAGQWSHARGLVVWRVGCALRRADACGHRRRRDRGVRRLSSEVPRAAACASPHLATRCSPRNGGGGLGHLGGSRRA